MTSLYWHRRGPRIVRPPAPTRSSAEVGGFGELRQFCGFRDERRAFLSRRTGSAPRHLRRSENGRSNELGVFPKVVQHARVFPAHRTIGGRPAVLLGDLARRADFDCAVDHGESRLYQFDIARGFTDKVLNLKREAEMEHIGSCGSSAGGVMSTPTTLYVQKGVEEGLPHLSEPDNYDFFAFIHSVLPSLVQSLGLKSLENGTPTDQRGWCLCTIFGTPDFAIEPAHWSVVSYRKA